MDAAKRINIMETAANFAGAAIYILFAGAAVLDIVHRGRFSSIALLALMSIFAFFFIIRKPPKEVNPRLYDWCIGLAGTFAPLLMRPAPEVNDMFALQAIQVVGMVLSIYGIASLNRSIGLVAADRGVKETGAYRFVRHPIYAGYFLSFTAFWAQNMTLLNTLALGFWMALEVMRIFAEEKVLSGDPAYVAYKARVKWRLLPFVF